MNVEGSKILVTGGCGLIGSTTIDQLLRENPAEIVIFDNLVREGMESIYDTFIDRVSTGRGLSVEEVQKGAEGRIFGGKRAVELKLVDELGGLEDAITYALGQAGLDKDGTVRIRGEAGGFAELLGGDAEAESKVVQQAASQLDPSQKLLEAFPAEVRSWVFAAMPMASGESAVLLTPFAIVVH